MNDDVMVHAEPTHHPARHPASKTESILCTSEVGALIRIFDDTINAIVLERAPPDDVTQIAESLVRTPEHEFKVAITPDERGRVVLRERIDGEAMIDDILFWAGLLIDLTDAELVGIRLARHGRAMCPRFHVDRVLVRICTTYLGCGTELLADAHADRRFLGLASGSAPDETSGLLRPGAEICRTPAGAIVLLKGEAWPGNEGRGAIHRSPACSEEMPRLVLTLDALG